MDDAAPAGWGPRSGRGVAGKHRDPSERPARPVGAPSDGPPRRPRRDASGGTTRLFVGLGRAAGVRPQDLVGAIANETSVDGRDIGAIEIADRFSLVEVPEGDADAVILALGATMIRGRKVLVRRERH